ncbi:hypothetical protein QJQ45_000931 [Haematococcus lacustris]|nr:hypothetical protein QJQ45_000931 [Haematococcus lacustris]
MDHFNLLPICVKAMLKKVLDPVNFLPTRPRAQPLPPMRDLTPEQQEDVVFVVARLAEVSEDEARRELRRFECGAWHHEMIRVANDIMSMTEPGQRDGRAVTIIAAASQRLTWWQEPKHHRPSLPTVPASSPPQQAQLPTITSQHLLTALLPDMPPVKKVTRISRANGAKAKARHEAAKSMEQLTAAHATLTAAHAALNADLLSSREQYSQLREWHRNLLVSAGQRDQQWELDLLGFMQQVSQLEEAFLQQLQGTQAQLTDTAAALEAAQKDLAAARTELAHTKQQLTTTNITDPAVFDTYGTLQDFLDDILELAAGQPCSPGLRTHLWSPACNTAVETTSADDNREAKAARKAEESACMVDGNAKMVLNVPTQAPLQQLQQAFQQHARGADYSNTSAKEATRFTREQLRACLLYHKVPPRDQPVGNTLVAGWQKAVQKHIAERGSPTRHKELP